jgi:predicted ABC-type ATPase
LLLKRHCLALANLKFIQLAKLSGFEITFFFVWLDSLELAKNRVASRVRKGGHNIREDVIERRHWKGIKNFLKYAQEADNGIYMIIQAQNSFWLQSVLKVKRK